MLGAFLAVMGEVGIPSMTLSGSLSATGSGLTATGTSRTMTVPATNPGSIGLDNLGGEGTLTLNVNGAGFSAGPWTIGDGQSIQARGGGLVSVGNTATGNLVDQTTGRTIESIIIERTS